jgi:hypothetical protein
MKIFILLYVSEYIFSQIFLLENSFGFLIGIFGLTYHLFYDELLNIDKHFHLEDYYNPYIEI